MKILFLTENFPPEVNAASGRIFERACYWVKWGHEVTVVTQVPNFPVGKVYPGYRNRLYQTEEMEGIRVVRVKTFIAKNEGVVRRILDFVSFMLAGYLAGSLQKRPDLVVANSPQFFTAVAGWMVSITRRVPFVFELADIWPASIVAVGALQQSRILRWAEKLELFLYRRAALVVSLTRSFERDLVRRGIPSEKIRVVINGVDLHRYSPRPKHRETLSELSLESHFCVGYIGTHGMAHDLGNVLRCADLLRKEKEVRFLFVGAGAEKDQLVRQARETDLPNAIFVPPRPKDRIANYWSVCDVALIHLKGSEVFRSVIPSKMFEAMAMGLPILLVSPPGEASEILEREGAGLCIPAGEPEALARAVLRLKKDPPLRRRLADHGLAAAPRHSREDQARGMLDALEAVARPKPSQTACR
jgi:glycosyltransferase involved in cell wall biosynthesis